jgi:hypothetical protein
MAAPPLGALGGGPQGAPQQQLPGLSSGLGLGGVSNALLSGFGFGPGAGVGGGGGGLGPQGLQFQFDPTGAIGIDKLNAAFAARQQQLLGGGAFLLPRT